MIKNKKRAIPNFFIALILVGGISWVCGKAEFNLQMQQNSD